LIIYVCYYNLAAIKHLFSKLFSQFCLRGRKTMEAGMMELKLKYRACLRSPCAERTYITLGC
jgi:hypothetical protein